MVINIFSENNKTPNSHTFDNHITKDTNVHRTKGITNITDENPNDGSENGDSESTCVHKYKLH